MRSRSEKDESKGKGAKKQVRARGEVGQGPSVSGLDGCMLATKRDSLQCRRMLTVTRGMRVCA